MVPREVVDRAMWLNLKNSAIGDSKNSKILWNLGIQISQRNEIELLEKLVLHGGGDGHDLLAYLINFYAYVSAVIWEFLAKSKKKCFAPLLEITKNYRTPKKH